MGEYAKYAGREIKIGTCEDMYYLRADQAHTVQPLPGSVSAEQRKHLRFRFPFPDEDGTSPGEYNEYGRSVAVSAKVPDVVEHYSVQFRAQAGYLVSLPCPEGPAASHGLTIHRNGFAGTVKIVQQAYRHGVLALICQCGGCGAKWNVPTLEEAKPIIAECRAEADRRTEGPDGWWRKVADRIEAGYLVEEGDDEPREDEAHGPLCPSRVSGECLCGVADRLMGA